MNYSIKKYNNFGNFEIDRNIKNNYNINIYFPRSQKAIYHFKNTLDRSGLPGKIYNKLNQ